MSNLSFTGFPRLPETAATGDFLSDSTSLEGEGEIENVFANLLISEGIGESIEGVVAGRHTAAIDPVEVKPFDAEPEMALELVTNASVDGILKEGVSEEVLPDPQKVLDSGRELPLPATIAGGKLPEAVPVIPFQPRQIPTRQPATASLLDSTSKPTVTVEATLEADLSARQVVPEAKDSGAPAALKTLLGDGQNGPASSQFRPLSLTEPGPVQQLPERLFSQTPVPVSGHSSSLPIAVTVGKQGWDHAMGERVLWMVGQQVQRAEVKISPAHLGPVDIKVSIQNDQASITFHTPHAAVREALETAVPRLREMLGENNLQLVNVDVNQRDAGEQRNAPGFLTGNPSAQSDADTVAGEKESQVDSPVQYYRSNGLVDDFA